ncbi:MAG: fructosamine kinase family protein [Hydrogenophilaceae bacterium]|nr:fructosamine kinase family protein [Hydrogenophilaceae bacterium]
MQCAEAVQTAICNATGSPFSINRIRQTGGGCISQTWILEGCGKRYFVKTHSSCHADMFVAETEGLLELESAQALRVPHPLAHGEGQGQAYLVLEYLVLGGPQNWSAMAQGLARLHAVTSAHFGWKRNNTIGSTPQINTWTAGWIEFLRKHRLGFQFELAARNNISIRLNELGDELLARLDVFFQGYRPSPSLLHGDLWSGNAAFTCAGEPVIFDPAVYFGDREADLAMTELFGGFGGTFLDAYRESWPPDSGYGIRKNLYNLYHILNHANLFGGGYIRQAETMTSRLLSEAG